MIFWQCSACAAIANCDKKSYEQFKGKCPKTSTGNHKWTKKHK